MEQHREKAAGLWDDAPWSELGLPPQPVVMFEENPEVELESVQVPPKAIESSPQTRRSSWD